MQRDAEKGDDSRRENHPFGRAPARAPGTGQAVHHSAEKKNRPKASADPSPLDDGLQIIFVRELPESGNRFVRAARVVRESNGESSRAKTPEAGILNHAPANTGDDQARVVLMQLALKFEPALPGVAESDRADDANHS